MLWTIVAILVALWVVGLLADIGGAIVHVLLVVALVALVWNLMSGRRSRV